MRWTLSFTTMRGVCFGTTVYFELNRLSETGIMIIKLTGSDAIRVVRKTA